METSLSHLLTPISPSSRFPGAMLMPSIRYNAEPSYTTLKCSEESSAFHGSLNTTGRAAEQSPPHQLVQSKAEVQRDNKEATKRIKGNERD